MGGSKGLRGYVYYGELPKYNITGHLATMAKINFIKTMPNWQHNRAGLS